MDSVFFRYANALFELSKSNENVVNFQESVKKLKNIFDENPKYVKFLDSYFVSKNDKYKSIDETLKKDFDIIIVNFIKVLIDNHRIFFYQNIFNEFNSLCNSYRGIDEGVVYSTTPLSSDKIRQIEISIEAKSQRKVELSNKIDVGLIGGIKVVIADKVYDGSLKNKLNSLKAQLLTKKGD